MKSQNKYQNFSYFCVMFQHMKTNTLICLLSLSLLSLPALAQEQQVIVPYTLADRDRAILTQTKMEVSFVSQQRQLDDLKRQLDDVKTLYYGGFGIITSLFLFMFGYMIWDRRTAMKPALEQASRAMLDNRNFLTVLRDYSKKHPDLADIIRTHGML